MPRVCSVCSHRERDAIDRAIVAGQPLRGIARTFSVSEDALGRHKEHLPARLVKAAEAEEASDADALLAQCRALYAKSVGILRSAEAAGDLRTALSGIREARGCLELLAKLLGELDDRPVVTIVTAPEWLALRTTIVTALAPFPDARRAVAGVLTSGEGGDA